MGGVELDHVLDIVIAGNHHVVVEGGVGITIAAEIVLVVVERDEFGRRLRRGFEHLGTGVGKVNLLVACCLHLGKHTEVARRHFVEVGHIVVTRKGIARLRLEEVGAGTKGECC